MELGGKTWGTGTGFISRFGGEMNDDGEFGGPAYDLLRNLGAKYLLRMVAGKMCLE